MRNSERVAQIATCFQRDQYNEAERLLRQALTESPKDPDLNAAQVMMMLWTQRELECIPHLKLALTSHHFAEAKQMAINALTCREQMAQRLGAQDPEGSKVLAAARKLDLMPEPGVGIGITAALIVKNEEKYLPKCLESLKGMVDEVVVVDTGSTDRTVEIATEAGCKVGTFEWIQDFSAARNASLELATQSWILVIDADEELTPESATMLREAVMRPQFGGYTLEIRNRVKGEDEVFIHYPVRLFRNDPRVRFVGSIHEQMVQGLLDLQWRIADLPSVTLIHHGYSAEMIAERDKVNRTVTLLKKEIERNPDFSFNWFNLANAYYTERDYAHAADAAENAVNLLEPRASYDRASYDVLCSSLVQLERYGEVLEWVERAEQKGLLTLPLEYHRCEAFIKMGRLDEALSSSQACLRMEWPARMSGDRTTMTLRRYLQAARLYGARGEYTQCSDVCDQVLKTNPRCASASGLRAMALAKMKRHREALQALEPCFSEEADRENAYALQADIYLDLGEPERVLECVQSAVQHNALSSSLAAAWRQAARQLGDHEGLRAALDGTADYPASMEEQVQAALSEFESDFQSKAIEQLRELIELNPQDATLHFTLGDLLARQEEWLDAADAYSAGLRLNPRHADGWFVLGNCLAHLQAHAEAVGAYQQCLAVNPNHGNAQHNRAMILQLLAA